MAILGWALSLVGIVIASAFVLRLMVDLFALFTGRAPKKPLNVFLRYGLGCFAGFAVFALGIWLGFQAK